MDILRKIDMLFEQEFTVSHEPVKSALLQTVGQVIKDVWDIDSRMGSYKGKKYTDVLNNLSRPGKIKELKANVATINIIKAKSAKSANAVDLMAAGVNDKTGAVLQTLTLRDVKKETAIKVIEEIIKASIMIAVENPKFSDRDRAIQLIKVIQEIGHKNNIDEESICAVVFELGDPDSKFSGWLKKSSEQGAEKIVNDIEKETGKGE